MRPEQFREIRSRLWELDPVTRGDMESLLLERRHLINALKPFARAEDHQDHRNQAHFLLMELGEIE